ncbi:MAG: carbohydrate kinase family protein [Planctomycetota bacterium]
MSRQRTVVGIGEALLAEYPQRVEPAGIAADVATIAVQLGHRGVAVARLGQDEAAREVMNRLDETGVNTEHLQSDPDLPTGRVAVESEDAASVPLPTRDTASDNLQWDYDLADLAQQADVVVFGPYACRHGQTRAVIHQFLSECTVARRLFDLTHRGNRMLDRATLAPLLGESDGVLLDEAGLELLVPGATADHVDTMRRLLRAHDLTMAMLAGGEGAAIQVIDADDAQSLPAATGRCSIRTGCLALLLALQTGADLKRAIEAAQQGGSD